MKNADVEVLYEMVSVGDVVELHGERNPELAEIFGVPVAPATVVASAPAAAIPSAGVVASAAAPTPAAAVRASAPSSVVASVAPTPAATVLASLQ
jgi:hypothetical protein